MSSSKLKFCANLTTMYVKESSSMLDRYSMAKDFGFKAVECAFPYDIDKNELKKVKEELGLEQILINTDPGTSLGFAALVGQEDNFMKSLEKAISYCQALDCKRLHIMSGKALAKNEASEDVLINNLTKALPKLEQAGIVGLIEPINPYWVPNYFLNDFDLGLKIVKALDHPNLRLMLDLFHLQYLKGNVTNNIKNYLPWSGHVQLAQVPTRHEPNSPGENDYKYVLKQLELENYQGWIGLEYLPQGGTNDGLSWIKEFGYTL